LNLEVEILKTIHRNPRVTPVLIHSMLTSKTYFEEVERILKFMRGLELVETKYRGIYTITPLGVYLLEQVS